MDFSRDVGYGKCCEPTSLVMESLKIKNIFYFFLKKSKKPKTFALGKMRSKVTEELEDNTLEVKWMMIKKNVLGKNKEIEKHTDWFSCSVTAFFTD